MKYLLTIALITFFLNVGISQSLNISLFSSSTLISQGGNYELENNYNPRFGFGARVSYSIPISSFIIVPEFNFLNQSIKNEDDLILFDEFARRIGQFDKIENNSYLGLGSLLKYELNQLTFGVGLGVNYLLISKTKLKDEFATDFSNKNQYLRNFSVFVPVEISYGIDKLDLVFRFERGLNSRLAPSNAGIREFTNNFQLGIGFDVL